MNASKNAIAQALKLVAPGITRKQLLEKINVPDCMTANTRYWYETYNILPWDQRRVEEQQAALHVAGMLFASGSNLPQIAFGQDGRN